MIECRKSDRFLAARWLGMSTAQEDVEWFRGLPDGSSNVESVEFKGDEMEMSTRLTKTVVTNGDWVVIGPNKQPMFMPDDAFRRMYEEVPHVGD